MYATPKKADFKRYVMLLFLQVANVKLDTLCRERSVFMYAVEFQSTIRDDGSIVVPREYAARVGRSVKVILLAGENKNNDNDLPAFSSVRVKTKGFKFDREYANER